MGLEPYKDKSFLYEHYVSKRMNLTDIVKLIEKNYGIQVSAQTIYNWVKKYDLLKYRGKGRNLNATGKKRTKSPMQQLVEKQKRELRKSNQQRKKGMGR